MKLANCNVNHIQNKGLLNVFVVAVILAAIAYVVLDFQALILHAAYGALKSVKVTLCASHRLLNGQ